MKTNTHPQYHSQAKISCANCGKVFTVGTTKEDLKVEICSACHPFYTGKKILIDTEGRVDKFRKLTEGATGPRNKNRRKKTLEERFNEEIATQIGKEKAKEAAAKPKKEVRVKEVATEEVTES